MKRIILFFMFWMAIAPTIPGAAPPPKGRPMTFKDPTTLTAVEAGRCRAEVRDMLRKRLKSRILPEPKVDLTTDLRYGKRAMAYEEAGSDKLRIFALIAEHLSISQSALTQGKGEVRNDGVLLAKAAAFQAIDINDLELAEKVADGWIAPYIEYGHLNIQGTGNRFDIASDCCGLYLSCQSWDKALIVAQKAMGLAEWDNLRDGIRLKMIKAYCHTGQFDLARDLIEQFEDISTDGLLDYVAHFEAISRKGGVK